MIHDIPDKATLERELTLTGGLVPGQLEVCEDRALRYPPNFPEWGVGVYAHFYRCRLEGRKFGVNIEKNVDMIFEEFENI